MKRYTLHGFTINVGERVWSFVDGWGTVTVLDDDEYSVGVKFDCDMSRTKHFTSGGMYKAGDLNWTLFWYEIPVHVDATTKKEKVITLEFSRIGEALMTPLKITESDLAETLVKIINDGYTVRRVGTDGTN